MPLRYLLSIALALLFFQLLFSLYYSTQIVSLNQQYSELQKQLENLKFENQDWEIKYIQQYSLHEPNTP